MSAPQSYVAPAMRSARPAADEATLNVGYFSSIPEVLVELGADPAETCTAAGLELAVFDDRANTITYRAASHLFAVCSQRTNCEHFGLRVGQKSHIDSLGFLGLLVKYSPDVRTALRNLVRYLHLNLRGAVVTFEEGSKVSTIGYEIYALGAEATDHIADGSLATILNMMIALCGPQFRPIEVRLEHRTPADVHPFNRLFRAPLRFGMNENVLVFASSWLNRPLPPVEPELKQLLRETVATLEARFREDFPEQVRSILRTALVADQGSIDQMAALLGMHSRTLHRRLAESGTSYRALVDECRYEIARQMLDDSDCDVGHIAAMLDYADTSAFARAFRRWSGTTPSLWRARQGRREPPAAALPSPA